MSESAIHPAFEALNQRGHAAVAQGRLEEAIDLFERLLTLAQEIGEQRLIDRAFCNRAAVAMARGQAASHVPGLREILMRNGDLVNTRLAAYNLALHFEATKSFKKAMFYVRIANQRSCQIGRSDWIASSRNLTGNILLAESLVGEAAREYEQALAGMPSDSEVWAALILANLGHCRVLQRRHREGFTLLFKGLRVHRAHGAARCELRARLGLSYAYIEAQRYGHARRHGERALAIAVRLADAEAQKIALYLLGEAANLGGCEGAARSYFTRLQNAFFPQAEFLTGMLLAVNVRKLFNLHA